MIVGVAAVATWGGLLRIPFLLIEAVTGGNVVEFGRVVIMYFIPLAVAFLILYLISSISARLFTGSFGMGDDSLTKLELSKVVKKQDKEE